MKVTFEGATIDEIQQLLAVSQMQSGTILTKEFFMATMQDVTQKILDDKAAFIAYVQKRDQQDDDLRASLKAAAATIVTDEAELADLHSQIDTAFAASKELGDTINPPPVEVPAVVDTSGNAAAGGTDSTSGSGSTAGTGDVGAGQPAA